MEDADRRPDRMIAAEKKRVAGAAEDRPHAAAVRLDPCRARIVQTAAVHRAPEVRVEFEVGAAPLLAHRSKQMLEMILDCRMRSIECVPWPAPPAAERHPIGPQRPAVAIGDEPIRMLLEDRRFGFSDE